MHYSCNKCYSTCHLSSFLLRNLLVWVFSLMSPYTELLALFSKFSLVIFTTASIIKRSQKHLTCVNEGVHLTHCLTEFTVQ